MQKWYQLYLGSWQNPTLSQGMWCPHACAEVLHAECRRPGYRSTAEHILTLCKDKEYAVPFLAGQYQKSLIDHALHRLDSQISMVSQGPCRNSSLADVQASGPQHDATW